jgi:hypothetical protein
METVLHARLPFAPWGDPRTRRLPGTQPLDPDDWLRVDEAYAGQMALRDRLIATREAEVHAVLPAAAEAAAELWDEIAPRLPGLGFALGRGTVVRPDGVAVVPDPQHPLLTLGRLLQEDFCLLAPGPGGEPVLAAAILCFPAGWRLDEKLGRSLVRLHAPVARYDGDVAARVARMMAAIRPGAPLWRANAHLSDAPLFNPLSEDQPRGLAPAGAPFVRSERQCLLRLLRSGAIVFSIHTYLVRIEDLTPAQAEALAAHPIHRAA